MLKYNKWNLIFVLIAIAITVGLRLYRNTNLKNENSTKKLVLHQLNFLESELKSHQLGERMQASYPEGYVFINAIYGLTWSELALNFELDLLEREKAFNEAIFAYRQIDSELGKSTFHKNLAPQFGVFYT